MFKIALIEQKGTYHMEEGEKGLQMYEDRFIRVESQVVEVKSQVVEVKAQLSYVVMTQQRHDTIIQAIVDQSALLSNTTAVQTQVIKAITDRTDLHQREIENLQSEQVDMGKVIATHSRDLGTVKRFGSIGGGAIVSLIVGYLLSHFIK